MCNAGNKIWPNATGVRYADCLRLGNHVGKFRLPAQAKPARPTPIPAPESAKMGGKVTDVVRGVDLRSFARGTNLISLCRPSHSFRRLASLIRLAFLLLNVFLTSAAFGVAKDSQILGDETSEQRSMRKVREQLEARRTNQERHPGDNFEQVKEAAVAELANGTNIFDPRSFAAHDGLLLPQHAPSIFEEKQDCVLLCLAGVVLVWLGGRVLARHRHEAEIRTLSGGYLSDGREVASFKMPEWFAPLPKQQGLDSSHPMRVFFPERDDYSPNPLAEFFAQVPKDLARIRGVVSGLDLNSDHDECRPTLAQTLELVSTLKCKADLPDLRPTWQLSSALELLLKRLTDRPADITSSTLQTVVDAASLLPALCVPGVRPDLIVDPPIRILAVDDDPLCLRALCFALEKAGLASDVATGGEQALALATGKPYDAIFMDIQMPEMDGLVACSKIRMTAANGRTPVIFVTIQSDFLTRKESTAHGGNDFMAKPFLIFELALKALILAMRNRLHCDRVEQAGTTEVGNRLTGVKYGDSTVGSNG